MGSIKAFCNPTNPWESPDPIYHTHVSPKALFLGLSGSFDSSGERSILETEICISSIEGKHRKRP